MKKEIKASEEGIKRYRDALGDAIVSSYIDGSVSTIELLASSESVTSFLDRQALREGLQAQLGKAVTSLKTAHQKLAKEKSRLAAVGIFL